MDRPQTLNVLASYEARLVALGVTPARVVSILPSPSSNVMKSHALWMVQTTRDMLVADVDEEITEGFEKAMRWLGFIQGALWASGVFTIEEMKDHNRSPV